MNKDLLIQSNADFDGYMATFSAAGQIASDGMAQAIDANKLHVHIATNDATNFDLSVSRLSDEYLYDEEIFAAVNKYYLDRGLYQVAHSYRLNAVEYYGRNGEALPPAIENICKELSSDAELKSYKTSLVNIRSLFFSSIPAVTPDIINEKNRINEFILNELFLAAAVMKDKIRSVEKIKLENSFSDLMLATLRLRFPFYGWDISDQDRVGVSSKKKDLGEADILIKAAGRNIALIEAFTLGSRNKTRTHEHVRKCENYIGTLERYYIIVYYTGSSSNFDNTWKTYEEDVLTAPFLPGLHIDAAKGFKDITADYPDARKFKLAMTTHDNNACEMYHLFINLAKS